MATPRLVPRGAQSGTSGVSASGSVTDVDTEGLRRLRLLCLFVAVAPAVKLGVSYALAPSVPVLQRMLERAGVLFAGGMLVSAAVYFVLGNERIACKRRLDVGFAYQIALALLIGLFRHLMPWGPDEGWRDISPVVLVIFVFAALIPNRPRRTMAASFAAAAMDPLALGISVALGNEMPPLNQALMTMLPSFGAAGIAILISRVVHGLARKVDEARHLGSYRLTERLGSGGMGEVWRAEHRLLARPAAIKLVRAGNGLDQAALKRFEREAQATACLQSPHTIHLYDYGVGEDGSFYYVMELLDGLDLEALVERHGPMPAERVVHVLLQICESLDEAHHQGLVHRDVKPANIYACRQARRHDVVKVLDFGLVKPRHESAIDALAPTVTAVGTIPGTPAFLAPETALGETDVDGRADIYALGCVAFWLLTGQFVFRATNAMKMVLAHVHEAPEPPSTRTEVRVPPELDRIVLDCLAKDPAKRPAKAEDLAERLRGVPLATPWTAEHARTWWNLHEPSKSIVPEARTG